MSFFSKIKNQLGIGGVKVVLQLPIHAEKAKGILEGKVVLTTKSEQYITDIKVKMTEDFTTGRNESKETKKIELGKIDIPAGFVIKPGDEKVIPFSLQFALHKTNADELKEMGGAFGAIGKLGAFANNEKSEYYVEADVDVKNVTLDPSDKKPIKIV